MGWVAGYRRETALRRDSESATHVWATTMHQFVPLPIPVMWLMADD